MKPASLKGPDIGSITAITIGSAAFMVDEIERLNRIMMNAPVIQKMIVRFLMTVLLSSFKKYEICQNAKLAVARPSMNPSNPLLS
jgi:hypothetical protein